MTPLEENTYKRQFIEPGQYSAHPRLLCSHANDEETCVKATLVKLSKAMLGSLRDLLPIFLVIAFFQFAVLQQPMPDIYELLLGVLFVVLGLTFFIHGLEQGLFPIGESMATAFARKGSLFWLIAFAFCLGFGTTVAEPALIAVAAEAADVASAGAMIDDDDASRP